MFKSPYSPFFTSGLLSAGPSRSSSPEPLPHPQFRRRGSLPTDSSSHMRTSTSDASAFYCTLQRKRSTKEFRSFLSLDLAESQSMRSSLGKKHRSKLLPKPETLNSHKLHTYVIYLVCARTNSQCHRLRAIAESPLRTSHNLLRSSRESLRSIPTDAFHLHSKYPQYTPLPHHTGSRSSVATHNDITPDTDIFP